MKTPLYRDALRVGWELASRHKWWWIFGLLAAPLGQMGLLEFLTKVTLASSDYALYPAWLAIPKFSRQIIGATTTLQLPLEGWTWFIWMLVVLVGLAAFFVFAAVVSQGALIYVAGQYAKRKKEVEIEKAWHKGVAHFWRLFFLNLLKKAIIVALAVMVGWATLNFVIAPGGAELALFLLIFILASAVGFTLSFLVIYAAGYVVVEEYSLAEAIHSAWRLFTDHWLVSIEVGVLVLATNLLVTLLALLGLVVFFFPTLITWLIAALTLNANLYIAGLIVGAILFTVYIIFLGSVFTVFTTSVWTYLFMKMHREGVVSRVLHWLRR